MNHMDLCRHLVLNMHRVDRRSDHIILWLALVLTSHSFYQMGATQKIPSVIHIMDVSFVDTDQRYHADISVASYYGTSGDKNMCKSTEIQELANLVLNISCEFANESVTAAEIVYTLPANDKTWCKNCSETVSQCQKDDIQKTCKALDTSDQKCFTQTGIESMQLTKCRGQQHCPVEFSPKRFKKPDDNVSQQYCEGSDTNTKICWDLKIKLMYQCNISNLQETGIDSTAAMPAGDLDTHIIIGTTVGGILALITVILIAISLICVRKNRKGLKTKEVDEALMFTGRVNGTMMRTNVRQDIKPNNSKQPPSENEMSAEVESSHLLKRDSDRDYDEIDDASIDGTTAQNATNVVVENLRKIQGVKKLQTMQTPEINCGELMVKPDVHSECLNDQSYQDICPLAIESATSRQSFNTYNKPPIESRSTKSKSIYSKETSVSHTPTQPLGHTQVQTKPLHTTPANKSKAKQNISGCPSPVHMPDHGYLVEESQPNHKTGDDGYQFSRQTSGPSESHEEPDMIDNEYYERDIPTSGKSETPDPFTTDQTTMNEEISTFTDNTYYETCEVEGGVKDSNLSEHHNASKPRNQAGTSNKARSSNQQRNMTSKAGGGSPTSPPTLDVGQDDYSYVYNHFPLEGRQRAPTEK